MSQGGWIGAEDVATIAGITRRSASRALARGHIGGVSLEVRAVRSTRGGGRLGICYEASLRSLSEALEANLSALSVCHPDDKHVPANLADLDAHQLVDVALTAKAGRHAIVQAVAAATDVSPRTAYRTVAKVRDGGHVAATRKRPKNAGQRRVAISRAFTRLALAAGWTEDQAWGVHEAAKNYARGLWTTNAANAGARRIAGFVRDHLKGNLAADLLEWASPAEAREAFSIPRRFVEDERIHSLLHRKRTDAKAHYDARPGALLDLNACRPMELVYGDVHHLDVKMLRQDGEEAFCVKMVAWMDAGNRRVFARFFNVPRGKMIRQEHVAETFALMAHHREFGMPSTLYIDNGSEYKMLDYMVDAFKLMDAQGYSGSLVHSTAYNPRGKAALESFFQHFERYYLSMMPGYAGGDRQRQKTANQGKAISAAPWAWEDAERILYALLDRYNDEARETLGNRSPNEAFRAAASDWSPVTVSMEALAFGHAKRVEKTNKQGLIRHLNRWYRLAGPAALAEKVTALVSPWMQDSLVVLHDGALVCAPLAETFHPLDRAGAKASAGLASDFNREIEALGEGLPSVNPLAELLSDRAAVLDLVAGPKGAMTKALSAKARRAEESREDAAHRARNDKIANGLAQLSQRRKQASQVA